MMAVLHGIDVSEHQKDIDWAMVAAHAPDLRFVMSRMSHGGHGDDDLRTDARAKHNRDGMRSAFPKTPRGFYHFLGTSHPRVQARHFQSVVGDLQAGEFLMLDVEPDKPAKVPVLPSDHIVATLEAIEERFGLTPWLYIGIPYLPNAANPRLLRFPFHFPHYHPNAESTVRADAVNKMRRPMQVWQWGGGKEGVRIQGIPRSNTDNDPQHAPRIDSNQLIDEAAFRATLTAGLSDGPPVKDERVPADAPLQFMPDLGRGAHGNAVFLLQSLLVQRGLFRDVDTNRDGKFEGGTERKVVEFQGGRGLPQTGRVDHMTWNLLGAVGNAPGALQFMPEIGRGAHGNAVFLLQAMLVQHGLFRDVDTNRDGKFEGGTERKVTEFQARHGLAQTGRVDHTTWNVLGRP